MPKIKQQAQSCLDNLLAVGIIHQGLAGTEFC